MGHEGKVFILNSETETNLKCKKLKKVLNKIGRKRRPLWTGRHAWRNLGSLLGQVIEEELIGEKPLGRPRLVRLG